MESISIFIPIFRTYWIYFNITIFEIKYWSSSAGTIHCDITSIFWNIGNIEIRTFQYFQYLQIFWIKFNISIFQWIIELIQYFKILNYNFEMTISIIQYFETIQHIEIYTKCSINQYFNILNYNKNLNIRRNLKLARHISVLPVLGAAAVPYIS